MTTQDELLDLVSERDEIIGTIWRAEYSRLETENLGYIRAVEMFIQNEKGEIWIPKRTAGKRIAPNGLDYSAAGHVSSGETYIEAMLKEISEELNLELKEDDLEFIATIGPDENRYIRRLYSYKSDVEPEYNNADFVSASWLLPDEIIKRITAGTPAKSTLKGTVKYYQDWLAAQNRGSFQPIDKT